MFRRAILLSALAAALGFAQSPESVRKEIEASYARGLEAMKNARSMDDLDEINRTVDTQDWRTIVPGQQPRTWPELRKYGFEGLWAPFQAAEIHIDTFSLTGDTAVFTGRLRNVNMKGNVSWIPLKETWKHTVMGWKRQIHQKFNAGETPR
jgi:hypothetical protein